MPRKRAYEFHNEEEKEQFIEDYKKLGRAATAEKWGIDKEVAYRYARDIGADKGEVVIKKKRKEYTEEEMEQFIEDYKELGCVVTAKKWGIVESAVPHYVVRFAYKLGITEEEAGVRKRKDYTEEEMEQFIEDYKKLGRAATAEKWGMVESAVSYYVVRFVDKLGIPEEELEMRKKREYTEEEMKQFIEDYKELGRAATAEKWGISVNSVAHKLRNFASRLGIPEEELGIRERREYTIEDRKQFIEDYKNLGSTATAKKWGIGTNSVIGMLKNFAKKLSITEEELETIKRKGCSEEEMKQFIEDYKELGCVATAKKWGVSNSSITYRLRNFARRLGIPEDELGISTGRHKYSAEEKKEVVDTYYKYGAGYTMEKYGVYSNALYRWIKESKDER